MADYDPKMDDLQERCITLDEAKEAFHDKRTNETAADYLTEAMQYWTDEMIGERTFLCAVSEVRSYLLGH